MRVVRGRLEMLEKELTKLESQVSRCKEWVKAIKTALKEKEKEYPVTHVACCCWPPSKDGSRCAGGNCACTEDYVCEKCSTFGI